MRVSDCHNVEDFRRLAKRRLPGPVFDYIDGGADDETTLRRNVSAYGDCDLVPNVLAGVAEVDMSVEVLGRRIAMPLMLSPTAMQRLFHWEGERAVGRAVAPFDTFFGISTIGTVSIEEIGRTVVTPKLFQLYVHRDDGLNRALVERCKAAGFDAVALTVDTIVGGNRERDRFHVFLRHIELLSGQKSPWFSRFRGLCRVDLADYPQDRLQKRCFRSQPSAPLRATSRVPG